MAVHLRLQRHGATHKPFYHIVAADQRCRATGRFLEKLGYYDPNCNPSVIKMDEDRIKYWYSVGAQPSETVAKLMKIQKIDAQRAKTKK